MRIAASILLLTVSLAADAPSFTVGALRRDGVVIPFAAYDGKRWVSRWPPPSRDESVPINLNSVPGRWWGPAGARESWQAWIVGEPREVPPLKVVQPDVVDVHCTRQIGLRTDRPKCRRPRSSSRIPRTVWRFRRRRMSNASRSLGR